MKIAAKSRQVFSQESSIVDVRLGSKYVSGFYYKTSTHITFTCPKSTITTLETGVKFVQS